MNKLWRVFVSSFFVLTACGSSQENLDYSLQRKHKFIQVIDILRNNNVDSIKKYVVNGLVNDTVHYISSIEAAQHIITSSNGRRVIDSIIQVDSTFYGGDSLYTYRLNFYSESSDFIGYVEMSFLSNDTQRVGNLNAEARIKDTATMRW